MALLGITPSAWAYASTTLGATLLSSVFGALYVVVFAKHWGITEGWFQTAQAVYLVWNAVNDPLFGWLQDRPGASQDNRQAYSSAILWGGPLFGASFLLPWIPLGDMLAPFVGGREAGVGIHCCLSLSLFDGMFTYVVLAQCGLFAELESSQKARSMVLAASQAATAVGGAALFLAYPLLPDHLRGGASDGDSARPGAAWMPGFFAFAMALAVGAAACFAATGVMVAGAGAAATGGGAGGPDDAAGPIADAQTLAASRSDGGGAGAEQGGPEGGADGEEEAAAGTLARRGAAAAVAPAIEEEDEDEDEDEEEEAGRGGGGGGGGCLSEARSLLGTWAEILSSRDFCLFVACNFLQVFDNTFSAALHAAAMPAIFRSAVSDATIGVLLGAGGVLAPLAGLALTPLLLRAGHSYPLIRGAFALKVGMAALAALAAGWAVGASAAGQGMRAGADGASPDMHRLSGSGVVVAAAFMVCHRALGGVTFGWFPLSVSDIIDADKAHFRRPRRLGTSVFGLNALIVKPAESLAPMLFAPVLHDFAAAALATDAPAPGAAVSGWWSALLWVLGDATPADGEVSEGDRTLVAWRLVWGVPAVCGLLQLLLWSFYSLRSAAAAPKARAAKLRVGASV